MKRMLTFSSSKYPPNEVVQLGTKWAYTITSGKQTSSVKFIITETNLENKTDNTAKKNILSLLSFGLYVTYGPVFCKNHILNYF